MTPVRLAALLLVAALLAACGNKGPLYLPDSAPKEKRPPAQERQP
jgi:predicted small lipoprotein YifL